MNRLFLIVILVFSFSGIAFSQGEDGSLIKKTNKPKSSKPVTTTGKTSSTPRSSTKSTTAKPKPKPQKKTSASKVVFGNLTIRANEPESEIFLSNADGNVFEGQESAMTDENGALELNEVAAGRYVVKARKPGFFDSETVIIVKGGTNNVATLTLRPASSFLSVKTNVGDAAVEIFNVGEFSGNVNGLMVNPGTYRVTVYKKGFVSESRTVSLTAPGQQQELSFELRRIPFDGRLAEGRAALEARDWRSALQTARRLLAIDPDSAGANLLAGMAAFEGPNSKTAVDSLARVIALGERVELPARIYNKDKNELQLIPGRLVFSQNALLFVGNQRADMSFGTMQVDVSEIYEKFDEYGLTYISLKARGDFAGKKDRRTVRIYPEAAQVKASRKELSCLPCPEGTCRCQSAEAAIYDLLLRWKNSRFMPGEDKFGIPPKASDELTKYESARFSIRMPDNWKPLITNERQVLASPSGGYIRVNATSIAYSVGMDVNVLDNPERIEHQQAHRKIVSSIQSANPYLSSERSWATTIPAGNAMITSLKGVSPASQIEEKVVIFTIMWPDGGVLTASTVCPADESSEYEPIFARIMNSLMASSRARP